MTDGEIVACSFQEWASYLADKYSITQITLFESNIERTLSETKVKKSNPFRGHSFEPDYFEIDGVRVTFKIPFDGEPDLFGLQPSSMILTRFRTENTSLNNSLVSTVVFYNSESSFCLYQTVHS